MLFLWKLQDLTLSAQIFSSDLLLFRIEDATTCITTRLTTPSFRKPLLSEGICTFWNCISVRNKCFLLYICLLHCGSFVWVLLKVVRLYLVKKPILWRSMCIIKFRSSPHRNGLNVYRLTWNFFKLIIAWCDYTTV